MSLCGLSTHQGFVSPDSDTRQSNVERTVASIDSLTARLKTAAVGLDSTSHNLASITGRLDAGEGTLGKLLTDERLYEDLRAAIENHRRSEHVPEDSRHDAVGLVVVDEGHAVSVHAACRFRQCGLLSHTHRSLVLSCSSSLTLSVR